MTKREEKLKTRPDLSDDEWLKLIERLPENNGLDVRRVFRRMIDWCRERDLTPSRLRLLKWLDNERAAVPIATGKVEDADCSYCSNERRVTVNDFRPPCPQCRPAEEKAFWKARGR